MTEQLLAVIGWKENYRSFCWSYRYGLCHALLVRS